MISISSRSDHSLPWNTYINQSTTPIQPQPSGAPNVQPSEHPPNTPSVINLVTKTSPFFLFHTMPTSTSTSNLTTPLEPPRKNRFLGGNNSSSTSSSGGWTRSLSNLRKEAQSGSSSGSGSGLASGSGLGGRDEGQAGKKRALTTDDLGGVSGGLRSGSTAMTSTTATKSNSSAGISRGSTPIQTQTPAPAPAKGLRAFFQSFRRSHSTPAASSRSTTMGGKGGGTSSTSTTGNKVSAGGIPSVTQVQPGGGSTAAPVVLAQPNVVDQQTELPQTQSLEDQQPIEPANIPLPPSPLLPSPTEINPFEPTPENTLDRAPTTGSIDTEPSLSNTDETLGMVSTMAGVDEAIVTPVTSVEGGSGSEGRLGVVGMGAEGGGFDEREEQEDEFEMGERARGLDIRKVGGEGLGDDSTSEQLGGSGDVTPTPASLPTLVTMGTPGNTTRPMIDTSSSTLSRTTSPISPSQSKPNSIPVAIPTRGSYVRSSSAGSNGGQASRSPPVANSARYQQHPQGPLVSPQMQYQQGRSPQGQPGQGGISPAGLVRSASNRFRQNSYGSQNKVRPSSSSS